MVLTKIDLDESINAAIEVLIQRFTGIIDDKLTGVVARISLLEDSANNNKIVFEAQAKELAELLVANAELQSNLDTLAQKFEEFSSGHVQSPPPLDFTKKLVEVEERLEERTNRQLRQTLVFTGIPEEKNESWDDTFDLLARTISKNLGISFNKAGNMLNRVHRGRPTDNLNKPRPIYAALYRWSDCEDILEEFRSLNISRKSSIRASYKYGPRTTQRRNLALMERKNLKDTGVISSGYLQYPAKLFGKVVGSQKYTLIKDFSNHEITFITKI